MILYIFFQIQNLKIREAIIDFIGYKKKVKIRQILRICHLSKLINHPSYSVFDHALKSFGPLRYQFLSKLLESFSIIFYIYQTFIECCNEVREQTVTINFYFLYYTILDIISNLNQSPWEFLLNRVLK